MRREFRRKENAKTSIIIGSVTAGVLAVAVIIYLTYLTNTMNNEINMKKIAAENTNLVLDNSSNDTANSESASTKIGKSVEEAENVLNEEISNTNISGAELNNVIGNEEQNIVFNTAKEVEKKEDIKNTSKVESKKENKQESKNKDEEKQEKELKFTAPVKGEIIREFATESLVYSNTLDEWVTHNGIDIKADKTSVVTAAANGTVYAIKNDPRYGLTVIINHDAGYKTVYSNLLTAEFVVEGEKVESGQTIGTVGNSASFEIGDDYHLHFEILKNNKYINPTTCINF